MPNVYLGADLEELLDLFKGEVLEAQEPWRHQEWTYSAMLRLLVRAGLDRYRHSATLQGVCACFKAPFGGSEQSLVPGDLPVRLVLSLNPLPSFRLRGLLYEELDGDAIPAIRGLGLGSGVGQVPGFEDWTSLLPMSMGQEGLNLAVRFPDRLEVQVQAEPGTARRGREARQVQDRVVFRLHALISPIQPGVVP